ncbi:MAG: HDOD domain-containing protein [Marinobacter sp.]|uniref:HDOD domain-containing protein n=1 Tax=Marinobacter sp. TaxID=50741 RepID=UPI00299E1D9C|nr:HDOD domain-containing protein [Marinobacter sp.]MDX1755345.1 HDOD domain-containing protein [Marinobacter sp.]
MPGFLSWVSGLFGDKSPAPPPARSRLLNPSTSPGNDLAATDASLDKLEQHLFCWLLDTPPSELTRDSGDTHSIMEELSKRVQQGKLDELPRQPMTLPMLMRALSDPDISRKEITDIILNDPALTDQLLLVANSPFFRPGDQTIESVDQAVFLLGMDGIRSVIAAAILRPMMAARNSGEALFAQRAWRWGLSCARAAELIARLQGKDASAYFMVGLLPALSYLTLYREILRIYRGALAGPEVQPAVVLQALQRFDWRISQQIANHWNLPPRHTSYLLAAERPSPRQQHTPLNDGIILGTREILRHAHQRNMGEDELAALLSLTEGQFHTVRSELVNMLRDGH